MIELIFHACSKTSSSKIDDLTWCFLDFFPSLVLVYICEYAMSSDMGFSKGGVNSLLYFRHDWNWITLLPVLFDKRITVSLSLFFLIFLIYKKIKSFHLLSFLVLMFVAYMSWRTPCLPKLDFLSSSLLTYLLHVKGMKFLFS